MANKEFFAFKYLLESCDKSCVDNMHCRSGMKINLFY